MSTYDKGSELEKLVTNLFKVNGYDARHNVKMMGRSGVEHQIDVYAEYKAPLHTSKIIVECKSYDKPIDKDVVMKLIHEVEDLGVDRGILVTTSYFTPDAVSTAEGYNVELWDNAKLREFLKGIPIEEGIALTNVFYIEPAISVDVAMKTVDATLKGMFGRKGSIENSSIVFYPYYEMDIDARIYESKGLIKKKIEGRITSSTILVDAVTGMLCNYEPSAGITGLIRIPSLSDEEAKALQMLSSGALTVDALASMLSCSTAKARKILQGLVAKGIAGIIHYGRQVFYQIIRIPSPSSLRAFSSSLKIKNGEPKDGVKIGIVVSLGKIEGMINLLWRGVIRNYKTVFYPYYVCKIVEEGRRYAKATDMLTNKVDKRVSEIFTSLYSDLPF